MEQENLFTASKWDILKLLAEHERSPIELAKIANTSVANVSQQLRLLEMAGLVTSKRISNRERGLPRVLYSLAGNYSYMIATTSNFVDKKMLQLSAYNKVILRVWFLENHDVRYALEKMFWNIEEYLPAIRGIYYDTQSNSPLRVLVQTKDKALKTLAPLTIKTPSGKSSEIFFELSSEEKKPSGEWYTLYDEKGVGVGDTNAA